MFTRLRILIKYDILSTGLPVVMFGMVGKSCIDVLNVYVCKNEYENVKEASNEHLV